MEVLNVYILSLLCVVIVSGEEAKSTTESWNIQDQCGRELHSYGGILQFDANLLRSQRCTVKIVGKGTNHSMLSMYFTTFNVSEGCHANLTIREPSVTIKPTSQFDNRGLYLTFCKNSNYLNENSMYTTDHNIVTITFDGSQSRVPSNMRFVLKFSVFTRVRGCEEKDIENGMFSCPSGRCVHTDVLCKDLNPCGDQRDCNVTGMPNQRDEEKRGLHYVNFIVIFAIVLFAVFALIQITLIVRNEQKLCYRRDSKIRIDDENKVRIEAELIPMKNERRVDKYAIEAD